ncbi:MAG: hypothetical protein JXR77_05195 [Lentisphaeria bacterium]|nr:hypothetical protein [Lentisphaeria bacterium]
MKRNPALQSSRERMAPGRLSRGGFLGDDERPLDEIVAADGAELAALGVTAAEIAELLESFHRAADEALETPRELCGGRIVVQETEVMGRIPCPFACGFRTHKANILVRSGDRTWVVTPMHAHLIGRHGFFQGRGSAFRVEPADLAALVRLCRGGVTPAAG